MDLLSLVGFIGAAVGVPHFIGTTPIEPVVRMRQRVWRRYPGKGLVVGADDAASMPVLQQMVSDGRAVEDLGDVRVVRGYWVGTLLSCLLCGSFWFGSALVAAGLVLAEVAPGLVDAAGYVGLPWAAYVAAALINGSEG